MSISISSRKAKGRNLQNSVAEQFRKLYPELDPEDIKPILMGGIGADIVLTPTAKKLILFDIECKAQESLAIWQALKQCETNTAEGRIPLLIFKRNHSETYATLRFKDLLKIIGDGKCKLEQHTVE